MSVRCDCGEIRGGAGPAPRRGAATRGLRGESGRWPRQFGAPAVLVLALVVSGVLAGRDRNRADQVIDYTNPAPEEVVARYVQGRYVDYATAVEEDSPAYDRCKTTHRCARAYNHFDPLEATYKFTKRVFPNGLHEPADMFTDFEGYEPGTTGWDVDPNYISKRHPQVQHDAAHFDPFALASYTPLHVNVSANITFNTDDARAEYSSDSFPAPPPFTQYAEDLTKGWLVGEIVLAASGLTEVAVFNFDSLYIGARVNVSLTGNRAIALTSRSANIVDTQLTAQPGELGGFLGDRLPSETSRWGNNDNGPGSGSLRVYLQTVTTSALNVDEVQRITTTAQTYQTLRGAFRLEYKGDITHPIPVDADPATVRQRIEEGLPLAGSVLVSRSPPDDEQGYMWDVTFVSAPGDVPQLIAHSELAGLEANVRVDTLVEGNTIRGSFTMSFGGSESRPLRAGASTQEVQDALEELPEVVTAHVVRNDPTSSVTSCEGGVCEGGMENAPVSWGQCEHGRCENGPHPAWGFEWQITITTHMGVVVPGSPTSPLFFESTDPEPLAVNGTLLDGIDAVVNVTLFQEVDRPNNLPRHNFSHYSPFNLAFGGAGASYGGVGGLGHARHPPPPTYLDDTLPDLLGGSGGAVGGELPQQAVAHESPSGRGGNGGGAIELLGYTDVIVGISGGINVDGQDAWAGYRGGGGGSGGAVHIVAGGVVVVHSLISARGGAGGAGVGHGSRGGGGGGGGRIAIYGQSVTVTADTGGFLDVEGGDGGLDGAVSGNHNSVLSLVGVDSFSQVERTAVNTKGHVGSVRRTTAGGAQYRVDLEIGGAADTQRCLRIDIAEETETDSGLNTSSYFSMNGPSFSLRRDVISGLWASRRTFGNGSLVEPWIYTSRGARPELVQFYVRLGRMRAGSATDNWLAHIALHEFDEYTQSNVDEDGNVIPGLSAYPLSVGETGEAGADGTALIGVAVVDGAWRYDSNYRHLPGGRSDQPQQHVFARNAAANQWYKVDIFIDWEKKEFLIRLDDIMRVRRVKFIGEAIRRIGLYSFHGSTMYYDEIYAGPADTMGFECPESQEGVRPIIDRPIQHSWKVEDYGGESYNWEIVRHSSHMSRRRAYNEGDYGGMVFYDGEPHRFYHSDIMTKTPDGDRKQIVGSLHAGNMVYLPGDGPSDWSIDGSATIARAFKEWGSRRADDRRGDAGRFFWFAEHDDPRWVAGGRDPNGSVPIHYSGGVMACSTTDLIRWRNEGTMFHFTNITDDEHHTTDLMHAERPKTIFNNLTQTYVMWMHADNLAVSLRLAGIAQGGYVNGPYVMYRTRLPDGNETTDLTLFRDEDGTAHLARTYYASVPYYMPEPVMQPLWESVKNPDGTINYPLNYHRAFYHAAYDNTDDIYQQRWRFEDKDWRIETVTEEGLWVETFDYETGLFHLDNVDRLETFAEENERRRLNNETIIELDEGFDEELQSTGRYLNLTVLFPLECDPLTCTVMGYRSAPEHRAEVMNAVLGVAATRNILGQGQPPVETRYKDPTDPANNLWQPDSVPAVKAQSWGANYKDKNIADNPPHTTPPDLLIGLPHIVEWRRAKYLALSRLTDDYLDTNGEIAIVEGEMEDEGFLMMVLNDYGRFGWGSGNEVRHTYPEDVYSSKAPFNFDTESDWYDRLHQFYRSENDRADDFVNFRDKRTNFNEELTDLCPRKHQTCQDKYAECQVIWAEQVLLPETPQLSSTFEMKSYSIAQPTLEYETCLAEHRQCLEEYQHCIQTQIPRDRS